MTTDNQTGTSTLRTREDLAKFFAEKGYTHGAEIGVLGGSYSIKLMDANPKLKMYCVDTWQRPGKWEEANIRLKGYNCELIRKRSLEAVHGFNNGTLDFVYIDASHIFDDVMRDIIEWTPKVRQGGIVAGHDYDNAPGNAVKDAVDMYVKWHFRELNILPEPSGKWITRSGQPSNAITWWFYA